jgi:RNA polymerase sigma factor (sigma-70 family)
VTNVARGDLDDRVLRIPYVWRVTDEALLAGFAVGDPEAAETFIARFQRRVYGVALAITRDARFAEDLAQEAFVRAWRHAETFDPRRGSVATWLIVIARNLAVDAMRTQPRSEFVDPDELEWLSPPAHEPDPADATVRASDVEWLRRALDEVPEEQRRAVVLAGILGFTAQDVAEREGIPIGTAKSRIRLAMEKLRRRRAEAEASR